MDENFEVNKNLSYIEKELEYSFLYKNDSDSMHLLLSILDHRHKYNNLRPKYILMKKLNTSLKKALHMRKDREGILRALRKLINDDVNRFELAVVVGGYAKGITDHDWINKVERLAINEFAVCDLSQKKVLYHNARSGKSTGLRSQIFHELKIDTDGFQELKRLTTIYCRKVLKKRIYQLNEYMDKQIVLDFNNLSQLRLEENNLTIQDLNYIYNKTNKYLYNNITKIYKESYWNGINDAVLERYSG